MDLTVTRSLSLRLPEVQARELRLAMKGGQSWGFSANRYERGDATYLVASPSGEVRVHIIGGNSTDGTGPHGLGPGATIGGFTRLAAQSFGEDRPRPGEVTLTLGSPAPASVRGGGQYQRHVLATGESRQAAISRLRVAVVGLGGVGMLVAEQLIRLGVGSLLCVDPDRVSRTNLNRLSTSTAEDARLRVPKTSLVRRLAHSLDRDDCIEEHSASVLSPGSALSLATCDLIFGCTDNVSSRTLLNRVAHAYLIPLIDVGVAVVPYGDHAAGMGSGRVSLVVPGSGCLHELGIVETVVPTGHYVIGESDPSPAVMSYNMVVAGLAVSTFLHSLEPVDQEPAVTEQWTYLLSEGRIVRETPVLRGCAHCNACLGDGDLRTLPWEWEPEALPVL
jgi:hypothetical protein